jgi:lipid-A-disaccharide synthase
MAHPQRIFLLAGEPSGDLLGGRLISAMRALGGDQLEFFGVGGSRMADQGMSSLFPMDELSLMGFAEVLPHLPRLIRRLGETRREIERRRPALALTIDSPGFALRLQRQLKAFPLARVHYVAPQVWAWRQSRAARIATDIDHLLALLPFEAPFFERHGLPCSFVGHPIIEEAGRVGDGARFRKRYELPKEGPVVCLLPGSRPGEVRQHLPILEAVATRLWQRHPQLRLILPTLPSLAPMVRSMVEAWPAPPLVLDERADRFDAYAASWLAIAASGTVSLELALARLPMITIYKTGAVTAWLARRMIQVAHVNLANLILSRPAVPELLQEDCTPDRIATSALALLEDEERRADQQAALEEAALRLRGEGDAPPSRQAAARVLDILANGEPRRGSR